MHHEVPFRALTLAEFNERLASSDPVPGGGSASAVAASLAASLVAMVAELSKRPKYMDHSALHAVVQARGRDLADRLLTLADEDSAAYGAFAEAMKLPKESDDEKEARSGAMRASARVAAEVPLRCVGACLEVIQAAESLAGRCNMNASSDLSVASLLAEAAARGAGANVRVNLPSVGDEAWAVETETRVAGLLLEITEAATSCRDVVASGGLRSPVPVSVPMPMPT